jgi:drug/metabolite transporter (DMT)-like permease
VSVSVQLLCGGAVLIVAGLFAGEGPQLHPAHISGEGFAAFAYLVVPGSIVAYGSYTWLLRNVPLSQVATYAYVNPLVAVLLGWAILGEQLTTATLAGAGLVVASVAAIVTREAAKVPATARAPMRARAGQGELLDETRPVS